jgi:hypothetical protein
VFALVSPGRAGPTGLGALPCARRCCVARVGGASTRPGQLAQYPADLPLHRYGVSRVAVIRGSGVVGRVLLLLAVVRLVVVARAQFVA